MEIDKYTKIIEESSSEFLNENLNIILSELENNRTTIHQNFSEIDIKNIKPKSWGVYVFYIKSKNEIASYEKLNKLWETNSFGKKLISPKVIQSRFKKIFPDKLHCLYVGKSENLKHRIEQHIHQKTAPSTYGLKISEHDRLHSDSTFEFSFFILKENPKNEINALKHLLVLLEKRIRKEMSPLTGKQ